MVLCHYLCVCILSLLSHSVWQMETADVHVGSREYQNGYADSFQIAMGLDSIWETRKTLWKPGLGSELSLPKVVTYPRRDSEMFLLFLMNDYWFLQTNVG